MRTNEYNDQTIDLLREQAKTLHGISTAIYILLLLVALLAGMSVISIAMAINSSNQANQILDSYSDAY